MNRAILFPILAIAVAGLIYTFYPATEMMDGHSMDHGSMSVVKPDKVSAQQVVGDIIVSDGWTKATLPSQRAAGGFVTIKNGGATADTLVSVSSPAASVVQIHEMAMEADIMKMRELPDGLALPASATVAMKPGGFHIMFMDLKDGFKEGGMVNVTLTFARAGTVSLDLPVAPAGK